MKRELTLSCFLLFGIPAYAGFNLSDYKNCTGLSLESLRIKNHSDFSVLDSYKENGYNYSVILNNVQNEKTECFVINNRKVILDIIPSIVRDSCSGQWDQSAKSPVWMSDIGGGKDGVNYFYYSSSNKLKKLSYNNNKEINEINENIRCQIDSYTKDDVRELNDSAYYLYKLGRFNDSLEILNKVIDLDPNRIVAYLNLADVYIALKNEGLAKENYLIYSKKMKKAGLSNKIQNRVLKFLS